MAQRQYEAAMCFTARCADMRHLWVPSTEYQGKPTQKPNYFGIFLVKKTQPQWHLEPELAGITGALGKLYATNPQIAVWPIMDGDMPSPQGKTSDFAKGQWLFSASSSNPPGVEIVQAGGVLAKLQNRVGVKPGDFCTLGVTAAVKQNDPRGAKLYLNAVVFTAPGEEIVFANSVSGAELMRMAQAQGLQVAGFQHAGGGFGGAPQGGNAPFGGHGGNNGFAPTPGGNASPGPAAGQFGTTAPASGFAAPSSGSPFGGGAPKGPFS